MASSQQARLVESTRGGFILEHAGYRYQKNRSEERQNKIYWRCTQRDTFRGTVVTNFNISSSWSTIFHVSFLLLLKSEHLRYNSSSEPKTR